MNEAPLPSVTKELNDFLAAYGNERDALNVALAYLQEARAWIIAQERCPHCFGDLDPGEKHYVCYECGAAWAYYGVCVSQSEDLQE